MSRHRNIRNLSYEEDLSEDVYGHSVDDDYGTSPSVEQFLYDRNKQQSLSGFIPSQEEIAEEEEGHTGRLGAAVASNGGISQLQSRISDVHVGARPPPGLHVPVVQPVIARVPTVSVSKTPVKVVPSTKGAVVTGFLVPPATPDKGRSPASSTDVSRSTSPMDQSTPSSAKESPAPPVPTPVKSGKVRDAFAVYQKERGETKDHLNLVVVGHVDAGKSTMMGHLLYDLGEVSQKTLHKYENESKKLGKQSFAYAWILDETGEERQRGVTMDVAYSSFETPSKSVTLLDAPGHKDFIPRMILGAAQADVAVLVVDATKGEFETGFETGGQTQEHALLIRTLGVSQLIVAVNKMDTCIWSQDRFLEIKKKLTAFLKQAGFKDDDVRYIPVSGLPGDNLVKRPSEPDLAWYSGMTLVEAVDSFRVPERPVAKPLRLCISDVFKGAGTSLNVGGRVESGMLAVGDSVIVMPLGEVATVKTILVNSVNSTSAFAGDPVVVTISGPDISKVGIGNVICTAVSPVKVTSRFEARIVLFNIEVPIIPGFPVELHYQGHTEPASLNKLISQVHKGTGEVLRKRPRVLTKNSSGVVEIEVSRPICIETYAEFKELGRFIVRSSGQTIAAGLVTKVL